MRPLSLTFGASLLPSFSLVAAAGKDCHNKVCHPIDEYCSTFAEACLPCEPVCDKKSHNFQLDVCIKECSEYSKFEPLKEEIHNIQSQQRLILILLIILLVIIVIRYVWKCMRWLQHKRCVIALLKKLHPKANNNSAQATAGGGLHNGKDLNATTIQNLNVLNNDIERAPSQIYSVTAAEGSMLTMTTPVSVRYPAENSTTPTTIATEYSYDNQALAVTPVSEKPNGGRPAF